MSLLDRIKSALTPDLAKARASQDTYANNGRMTASNGLKAWNFQEPRKRAELLRRFADNNEFTRTAINRRKRQIAQASWRLVRRDKPNSPPDAMIERTLRDLFDRVNPMNESFRTLADKVIEDLLILDAGCIEKEKTLGGQIVNLWSVNGASVAIDPDWDGSSPRDIRYRQMIDGQVAASFRNDQLIYMMANPSTHRVYGWSPIETLFRVVRAELYGGDYEYDMLRQNAPNTALYLGPGVTDQQRERFIEYWEAEVAGQKAMAVLSGGDKDGRGEPKVLQLRNDTVEQRLMFYKWLATKVAAVFEMDLLVFNLSETVQKSVGNTLTARTDEGANGLASLFAEFITREIVWEIDPTRQHKFEFDDLNARDAMAQAKIDQINTVIGATFPNEIRARDGKDPVPWGDEPYASQTSALLDNPDQAGDGNAPNDSSQNPDDSNEQGSAKSAVPFDAASQTRSEALSYLAG